VSILTLVNASGERKTPQTWSHKWHRIFGQIVTCCRAKHSAELFSRTSAHLY